jgi:hypothetical protein
MFAIQPLHPDKPLLGFNYQATSCVLSLTQSLLCICSTVPSQVAWSSSGGNSFLGGSMAQPSDLSAHTADLVDAEVKDLVERAYRCDALLWLLVCNLIRSACHRMQLLAACVTLGGV